MFRVLAAAWSVAGAELNAMLERRLFAAMGEFEPFVQARPDHEGGRE